MRHATAAARTLGSDSRSRGSIRTLASTALELGQDPDRLGTHLVVVVPEPSFHERSRVPAVGAGEHLQGSLPNLGVVVIEQERRNEMAAPVLVEDVEAMEDLSRVNAPERLYEKLHRADVGEIDGNHRVKGALFQAVAKGAHVGAVDSSRGEEPPRYERERQPAHVDRIEKPEGHGKQEESRESFRAPKQKDVEQHFGPDSDRGGNGKKEELSRRLIHRVADTALPHLEREDRGQDELG